ncbi:hypothetical protein ASPWEDRAFT_362213 [Aspergillus wentii DTO 134E9]|uniref:Uncharacterized protein n=1 Tax=Aspergillus wentii DTO 134E9 TaxID=1073089 RepID=A0A1L9RWG0_ASPWE|nr:uncharacterized protein ASPWEDRAFT_362213 [Aspergillus wentii DTO 134E9]OJJ39214.1 hypothetical protein ASPWEDRAFT_362213 [Aspergillus wentii DTO 134E9]
MPRKKNGATAASQSDKPSAEVQPTTPPQVRASRLARIPSFVRYLLVVFISLTLSSTLFSLTSGITLGELGGVSKHLDAWWEVGGLIGWKAIEIGLAWTLGFDGRDVFSFLFLTHLPTYSLLSSFYGIRPTTILVAYAITLFSTTAPFVLLRQPTSVHDLSHAPSGTVSNRSILDDRATTIYTTVAATSIFAVVLYSSYATWLPAWLVVHFENIPDISVAHAGPAGLPVLFLTLLPAGWAARDYLFVSSTGAANIPETKPEESPADRHGEYLACAIYRRTWGSLSRKSRVLLSRTFNLASLVHLNTIVQVAGTMQGVDFVGASRLGLMWAAAILITGATFGWIEAVDGV